VQKASRRLQAGATKETAIQAQAQPAAK
jgi:hypothetical protein